ncbi:MAG: hypothetical protein ACP5UA_04405 [Candidatus Hydrogenedens sp.]
MAIHNQKLIKIVCIALALYLLIAVLHGLLPGIWDKSFGGKEGKGPFRILMFTPLLVLLLFFTLMKYPSEKNIFPKPKNSYIKVILQPNSHRGPPSFM